MNVLNLIITIPDPPFPAIPFEPSLNPEPPPPLPVPGFPLVAVTAPFEPDPPPP